MASMTSHTGSRIYIAMNNQQTTSPL